MTLPFLVVYIVSIIGLCMFVAVDQAKNYSSIDAMDIVLTLVPFVNTGILIMGSLVILIDIVL